MNKFPNINELLMSLNKNYKEVIKGFDDVISLSSCYKREILLGDIEPDVGEAIVSFIRFYNQMDDEAGIPVEERQPIKIFVDSNGGDLCATFSMIDAIRMSKTPVWTINMGAAYSGGFFTFIAGHKRFAYPSSSFLFHEGNAQNGGTSGQFENFTSFYKKELQLLKEIVLRYTKISEEEYENMKREDIWYTAQEAYEKGCVDEICKELM